MNELDDLGEFWAFLGNAAMEEHLTTKQIADALQVSESSVKRWCDSGAIPTVRTVGGHRRIPLDGFLQFLESTNRRMFDPKPLGVALGRMRKSSEESESVPPTPPSTDLRSQFEEALLRGDESESRRAFLKWFASKPSVAQLADELVAETFHRLGDMWDCEQIEIYQERRGCEICSKLIYEIRRIVPDPSGDAPIAIGGSPQGDHYSLASQLIELVLREAGWRSSNLGANLPFETLLKAAQEFQPKLFWLSVSHIEETPRFFEEYSRFAQALPPETALIVGGRALNDQIRPKLRFTAHCDNMQQLAHLATNLRGFRPSLTASNN